MCLYFPQHNVFQCHWYCRIYQNFLLKKSGCYSIVCIYCVLLIHPSTRGHWACFFISVIVNDATMSGGVKISFLFQSTCPWI